MNILNKILKNKNVMLMSLVAGISGLINIFAVAKITSGIEQILWNGSSSLDGIMVIALICFWVTLTLCLVGAIVTGYHLIEKKDQSIMNLLMFGANVAGTVFSFMILTPYNALMGLMTDDYSALMDLYSIATNISTWKVKYVLFGFLCAALIGLYFYAKKNHSAWVDEIEMNDNNEMPQIPMDPAKKKKIIMISGGVGVAIVALWGTSVAISAFNRTEVDLMANCELNIKEGYSGAGKVDVACIPAYETEDMTERSNIESLIYGTKYTVEPSENLSNGDKVTVRASYDEERAKENKLKVNAEPVELTVSGLEEVYTSANEVPQNIRATLEQKAEEAVREKAPDYYLSVFSSEKTITNMSKIGEFCEFENSTYYGTGLAFYYVYEVDVQVTYSDGDVKTDTVYAYAKVSEIKPNTDMTYVGVGNNLKVYEIYQSSAQSALNSLVSGLSENYEDLMN